MDIAAPALTVLGLLALLASLPTLWRICTLPEFHTRAWLTLLALVLGFILGYIGYLWMLHGHTVTTLELIVAAIFGAGGCFVYLVSRLSADTIKRLFNTLEDMRYQAEHDLLTGLPNRNAYYKTFDFMLKDAQPFACLIMDLDDFKTVNDTYGHHIGDRVLQEACSRLLSVTPDGALCARLGGDEFAMLLPGFSAQSARELCQQIHQQLVQDICFDGLRVAVGISIGISQYPRDADDKKQLMKFADIAMYHAKKMEQRTAIFTHELVQRT
ncbi:diguanylate cyclase domain-containing protein [Shewanella sp.]|uniref:diguanylate cyclase domain-containing protein n=1 Tax=Shewanella sp. TaxID=50422 RepID=UPI003562ECF6